MMIRTLFAQHDYACRTDAKGGVLTLTPKVIRRVCRTCPARTQDRVCVRNIVAVEKKLTRWKLIAPTTIQCRVCKRHVLADEVTCKPGNFTCEWCVARRAQARTRTICKVADCGHQGFRDGLCQKHFAQKQGKKRNSRVIV